MLVLSREANQNIMIGNHIVVTILKVTAGKIKIGITAPENIPVVRPDSVQAEKRKRSEYSMKFDTQAGYALMHLYLTLHPKKSPAYDPTEEGYISDEAESRLHHFAEFIRFNEHVILQKENPDKTALAALTEEGWQDFISHFTENVNGDIEFAEKDLPAAFEKFRNDIQQICQRPHSQLERELAKALQAV